MRSSRLLKITLVLCLAPLASCALLAKKGSSSSDSSGESAKPKAKVKSIKLARADGKATWCAGEAPVALVVKAKLSDGSTEDLDASAVELSTSTGNLDGWTLSVTPTTWEALEQPVAVSAKLKDKPTIVSDVALAAAFDCEARADVRGAMGPGGEGGNSGPQGDGGSSSSPDARAGGPGGNGGNGGDGDDTEDATVELGYLAGKQADKRIRVRVQSGDKVLLFLRDPAAPALAVDASGGPGGPGGGGGSGGGGGFGHSENTSGSTTPNGRGGDGGPGGNGGNGGNGGKGGKVTVLFDKASPELKDKIAIENGPGAAGAAGSPGGQGHPGPSGSGSQGPSGASGEFGPQGQSGHEGHPGKPGPAPKFKPTAAKKLFAD